MTFQTDVLLHAANCRCVIRSLRQFLAAEKHRISTRILRMAMGIRFQDPDCPTLVVNSNKTTAAKSVSEWAEGAAMSAKGGALGASSATRAWPLCYWSTPWPTVHDTATAPRRAWRPTILEAVDASSDTTLARCLRSPLTMTVCHDLACGRRGLPQPRSCRCWNSRASTGSARL